MVRDRPLTPRQHQILRMVARGETNKEIAGQLEISEQGVKAHISRLLERYGAANRVELVSLTRAWSDADQRGYATLAVDVASVRHQLGRGAPAAGLIRTGLELSPNSPDDLSDAIASLRSVLNELDVAMRLATEIPANGAKESLLDAVRARTQAALEYSERVAELVAAQQAAAPREPEQVAT